MRQSVRSFSMIALAATLGLSACAPDAPPGVNRDDLDAAVSKAIGDPSTCLLIAKDGSGLEAGRDIVGGAYTSYFHVDVGGNVGIKNFSPAGRMLVMPNPKPSSGPMRFGSAPQP